MKEEAFQAFEKEGFASCGIVIDPQSCLNFLRQLKETRPFSSELFMSEADFRLNPIRNKVNPMPGRNILEKMDASFAEENPALQEILKGILGKKYSVIIKKVVAAIPVEWLPNWVTREIEQVASANLGAFIKPEFRDVIYFHGIDFHQDLIDYSNRNADFITVYIYLDNVGYSDSPFFVLPDSHKLGATPFPHQLKTFTDGHWTYSDGRGHEMTLNQTILTGKVGSTYLWHACTLHGTQPTTHRRSSEQLQNRISLRYLIAKDASADEALIDKVNAKINGPLSLSKMREDIDVGTGTYVLRQNIINKA